MNDDLYIGWDELLHYDTKLKEYLEDKLSDVTVSEEMLQRIVQELLSKYVTTEDAQAAKEALESADAELVVQIDNILSSIAELDAGKVDEGEFETFQASISASVEKLETDLTTELENTFESVSLSISDLKDATDAEFAELSKVVTDNATAVKERFDLVDESIESAQATAIQKATEQATMQDAVVLAEAQEYADSLGSNYDKSGAADAIKAELAEIIDNKVDQADGKSLIDTAEIDRLAKMSNRANRVDPSTENGKIKIDDVDTTVYTHPDKHSIAEVDGLQDALDTLQPKGDYAEKATTLAGYGISDAYTKEEVSNQDAVVLAESEQYTDDQNKLLRSELVDLIDAKQPAGNYAPAQHGHLVTDIIEFKKNVAETIVDEAVKSTKDGDGNIISETYAKKATTLAEYGITDAYTGDEVSKQDAVVLAEAQQYADTQDAAARDDLIKLIDGKQPAGSYAPTQHAHVVSEITDFGSNVAQTLVNEAVKASQDGNGDSISETYAKKATTLEGYGITDAYTKTETSNQDAVVLASAQEFASSLVTPVQQQADKNTSNIEAITHAVQNLTNDVHNLSLKLKVVASFDEMTTPNVIYLLPVTKQGVVAYYDEYVVVKQTDSEIFVERIGDTEIDLTDYVKKSELRTLYEHNIKLEYSNASASLKTAQGDGKFTAMFTIINDDPYSYEFSHNWTASASAAVMPASAAWSLLRLYRALQIDNQINTEAYRSASGCSVYAYAYPDGGGVYLVKCINTGIASGYTDDATTPTCRILRVQSSTVEDLLPDALINNLDAITIDISCGVPTWDTAGKVESSMWVSFQEFEENEYNTTLADGTLRREYFCQQRLNCSDTIRELHTTRV